MKLYIHPNLENFSNCYVVVNEENKDCIIIDPGKISEELISLLEDNNLNLVAVFITHNHGSHVNGIKTLQKIYNPQIYAADYQVAGEATTVIAGDDKIKIGKLTVYYMSIPGHTTDSVVYRIENLLFTGDVIFAGTIGETNSSYSEFILKSNIENKIYSQLENLILMPGHGPPTTLAAAKEFNISFKTTE